MRRARQLLILTLLSWVGVSLACASQRETFIAGKRVRMKAIVPAGYSFTTDPIQDGVTMVSLENPVWRIALRVYIESDFPAEATTEEGQRNLVVRQSSVYLPDSKEGDYKWQRLSPDQGSGVYCIFTDADAKSARNLKPDEFLHVVVGAKAIRGAVMYFQIYANDLGTPEYQEIMDVVLHSFDRA